MAKSRRTLRRAQRRILFFTLRTVLRITGFGGARPLGSLLGSLHYAFGARLRKRCTHDLAALTSRAAGDPAVASQLLGAYRLYTAATLEVLAMIDRKLSRETLGTLCRIDGLEQLEAARRGHGAILLGTHSGNSMLVATTLASAGWPMTVVYRQARMMSAGFFAKGLPQYGIEAVLANDGRRAYSQLLRALKQNRIVFILIDQGVKSAKDGIPMRFLGKDMPMPAGPAHLARNTGAPILPLVTLAANPVWQFAIEAPIALAPDSTLESDVRVLVRQIERQVLAHPELWSWQQRRWSRFPLAAPAP